MINSPKKIAKKYNLLLLPGLEYATPALAYKHPERMTDCSEDWHTIYPNPYNPKNSEAVISLALVNKIRDQVDNPCNYNVLQLQQTIDRLRLHHLMPRIPERQMIYEWHQFLPALKYWLACFELQQKERASKDRKNLRARQRRVNKKLAQAV